MCKKTIAYRSGEIGKVKVVKDFLPPPDKLVLRETAKHSVPTSKRIPSGKTRLKGN